MFAELLDRLALTPSRNARLELLAAYFRESCREEAGWALAILTGALEIRSIRAAVLRDLIQQRVDPILYQLSYDYVGDQAETIAALWPAGQERDGGSLPGLAEVVERLRAADKGEAEELMVCWLGQADAVERWALIKLATGATLRVGVSARLARMALARAWGREVEELERVWGALEPPYAELWDWLEGKTPAPVPEHAVYFHPPMLAHPLEEADWAMIEPGAFAAEWKWDGVRVQLASDGKGLRRLFSRTGEEMTAAFADLVEGTNFHGVLDGELLVRREGPVQGALPGTFGDVAPFSSLQQRLNRRRVSARLFREYPVMMCVYDVLFWEGRDWRGESWEKRRALLEGWFADRCPSPLVFRLSPLVRWSSREELKQLWEQARSFDLEGLMLKRRDSAYLSGRPRGVWFKWKRRTLNLDAVLMYAQRGHGKRSSYYSDYTFGVWRTREDGGRELVPVGKAYSGFTDEELGRLDRWIRANTVERFGSVRAVAPELVLEVEFDALQRSSRHKSGVAMRFPRIQRIRWDKPAHEAATLEEVRAMLPPEPEPRDQALKS